MNSTEKTTVIFRKYKPKNTIIALFPYDIHNGYLVTCYIHIGQHMGADYNHCIKSSKPAKPNEYEPLKKELESIGYNLEVREKYNHSKYLKAYQQSKQHEL